jgi:hypothetical protein
VFRGAILKCLPGRKTDSQLFKGTDGWFLWLRLVRPSRYLICPEPFINSKQVLSPTFAKANVGR